MDNNNIVFFDDNMKGMPKGERVEILAANGLFVIDRVYNHDFLVAEGCTRVWQGDYTIPGLRSMQEGLKYNLPLIPPQILDATEGLFDWVVDTYSSESMVLLYFSPLAPGGKKWQVRTPIKQVVTAGSVHYTWPDTPRGFASTGDIHSHASGGAFHSGVDDGDEEGRTGLFVTLGNNGSSQRRTPKDYDCSFMIRGKRFDLDPEEIFEGFEKKFAAKIFPEEWKYTVEKPKPKPVKSKHNNFREIPGVPNIGQEFAHDEERRY